MQLVFEGILYKYYYKERGAFMWEMIEQMASNRLWIYTALAGSVFGAGFLFWFKDTKMATWAVQKFDATLEYLAIRWGWTWLQNDPNAWRVKYPKITSKIDELEARLAKLEGKKK
jgi:hypothetical protein